MWFLMRALRRYHPVRCIRHGLILISAIILAAFLWQYVMAPNDYRDGQHNHSPNLVRSKHPHDLEFSRIETDLSGQGLLDYIGRYLDVLYTIAGNENGRYYIDVALRNTGPNPIKYCCWAIYFYHTKFLDLNSFNRGTPMRMAYEGNQFQKDSNRKNFTLVHVNGYTFRLRPTAEFVELKPGELMTLRLGGPGWAVSRSEVIPNWYVADEPRLFQMFSSLEPRLLQATAGEELKFVGNFEPSKLWTRGDEDASAPFSPDDRFLRNRVYDLGSSPGGIIPTRGGGIIPTRIIPTPLSIRFKESTEKLKLHGRSWKILYVLGLENEAWFVQERLGISSLRVVEIPRTAGKAQCQKNAVTLHLSDNMPAVIAVKETIEAYVLVVGAKRNCISIFGPSTTGVFRGAVSLFALSTASSSADGFTTLPGVTVVDAPRYSYRGVMIDVVRNFHNKEELLRLVKAMAMYKLNKLHLHLSDDEGWRLQIPGLDELTQVGAVRGHTLREDDRILSFLGSGPFTNSSGSGFYTVNDYREILRFARSHHIEVIPEFDMPGHSHAAIKSMEVRYARLMARGDKAAANRYLLSDLADQSDYMSGQYYRDGAVNPCMESSYQFVDHVVREVKNMHVDIMPLKQFHFGGDEVPVEAYSGSPACAKFLHIHGKLTRSRDLKIYFVRRVALIVDRYGLSPMGWEDAFSMGSTMSIAPEDLQTREVVSQAWYNIWESGFANRAYQYANKGYKVVLSPATHFYYDNPQEPDPEDWGLHWATRYISTKRSFNFMPESMYDSIDYDFWGRRISKGSMCNFGKIHCIPLRNPKNILGIEAVMWSELIRTPERMDSMLWPRLLALAERSWHRAEWETMANITMRLAWRSEDWMYFSNTVGYQELRHLEAMGINYYLPRPGARVRYGKLWVNTAFPGLIVQVSSDDGHTWKDYRTTASYRGRLLLATRSHDGLRRSVPVSVIV